MENTFENEVVYITGASAGIGYATAELCLQHGATVVITGRNKDNLDQAQQGAFKGFIKGGCPQCRCQH